MVQHFCKVHKSNPIAPKLVDVTKSRISTNALCSQGALKGISYALDFLEYLCLGQMVYLKSYGLLKFISILGNKLGESSV